MSNSSQGMIFYSSIKPKLMKKTLMRGTLLGSAGVLVILGGGTMLPIAQLEFWGLPILLAGLLLIAVGLVPQRKLAKLEINPHEIHFDGERVLFLQNADTVFDLPFSGIEKIDYLENKQLYGWGLRLKKPIENTLTKKGATFITQHFEGYDLFLPYFTKRSLAELHSQIPA